MHVYKGYQLHPYEYSIHAKIFVIISGWRLFSLKLVYLYLLDDPLYAMLLDAIKCTYNFFSLSSS